MSSGDVTDRLRLICSEVGFALDSETPELVARLELLAEYTETTSDSERMISVAHAVFRYQEATRPAEAFSPSERRIVVLGCLFSDIGKTGPAGADVDGQRLVAEIFAVEGVRDDRQPVNEFFRTYFPADAEERIRRFSGLGLDPAISIREFWNLHSGWTLQIAEAGGVPPEAIAAAATHHLLEDVNPDAIVGADRNFTRQFGDNAAFDRAEKLVILVDKYDALRRRAGRSHEQAIQWLHDRIESNPRFRGDAEFASLIADLDAVAGP